MLFTVAGEGQESRDCGDFGQNSSHQHKPAILWHHSLGYSITDRHGGEQRGSILLLELVGRDSTLR